MKVELRPEQTNEELPWLDRELAPLMWGASLLFLGLVAALLHLSDGDLNAKSTTICLRTAGLIYLMFPLELVLQRWHGGNLLPQHYGALLFPPLRMATRDHGGRNRIWLPFWGWQTADRDLERRLHDAFSIPMMGLALLVLPLIAVEWVWSERIINDPFWHLAFQGATGLVWMAFVIEFMTMISVTANRKKYLLKNWIDVVVILLPLVAFLRSVRLARLLKVNQVSKSVRLYRMRGVIVRTWRAVVALDILDRIFFRDLETRVARLRHHLDEREHELEQLRRKIAKLEVQLAQTASQPAVESGPDRDGIPDRGSNLDTKSNTPPSSGDEPEDRNRDDSSAARSTDSSSRMIAFDGERDQQSANGPTRPAAPQFLKHKPPGNQPSRFSPVVLDEGYLRDRFSGRQNLTND